MIKELHGVLNPYELLPYMSVSIQNKYIYSISEVVFWLSSAYEHIMKNTQKPKLKMSKKEEKSVCTSQHYIFAHKFLGKNNILCGLCKKRQQTIIM
jgi:hypothetical protein